MSTEHGASRVETDRRRKKRNQSKVSTTTTTSKDSSSLLTSRSSSDGKKITGSSKGLVCEAIDRIIAVRERTVQLYSQWTYQLLRLSFLVVFMTLYQSYSAILKIKIDEIASSSSTSRGGDETAKLWELLETWIHRMKNVELEICNVLLAVVLVLVVLEAMREISSAKISQVFLTTTRSLMFHWTFLASTMLTMANVGLFKQGRTLDETTTETKEFPVSVLFYFIATCAYSFMSRGLKKMNTNVQLARSLQKKLEEEEEMRRMKKL